MASRARRVRRVTASSLLARADEVNTRAASAAILIDGAWALEELNAKAVVGSMEVLHAAIAREMDGGYGGLYCHLWGELRPHEADRAYWLSRPRGIEFRPALEQIAQSGGAPLAVWRRFMVLGPGTEFVILGRGLRALEVPDGWRVNVVERSALASASPGAERAHG